MKAFQITGKGETRVADIARPELRPGHVLLRLAHVGFCGSDLNTFRGLNPLVKLPIIPGHEIGAVIEEVGEGVPAQYVPGTRVTVNPYTSCGDCPACRNRRDNACRNNETLGVQRNGAMAEYIVLPWEKVIPENSLTTRELALVEPMSVGFHAVSRAQVTDTDFVMVVGCGMIGVGAIVRASLRGATVIAVDVDDEKLALARRLGAAHTVNSLTEDLAARVAEITGGNGVDVAIEAVGRPETYRACVELAAFTGRIVYIGYAKSDIEFNTSLFVKKEIDIRGSRNATPEDFRAVIKYMKRGECPADELISAVCTPETAHAALESWNAAPGKVFRILMEF